MTVPVRIGGQAPLTVGMYIDGGSAPALVARLVSAADEASEDAIALPSAAGAAPLLLLPHPSPHTDKAISAHVLRFDFIVPPACGAPSLRQFDSTETALPQDERNFYRTSPPASP